jgi:hypothetical protein
MTTPEEELMKNLSDGEDMPSGVRDPEEPTEEDSDAS